MRIKETSGFTVLKTSVSIERFEDYVQCRLCPRLCGVHRAAHEIGVCGETATCRVASYGPHFGEEPCFSGSRGSGTIFFAGCSSHCFFCQNYQISNQGLGHAVSPERLVQIIRELATAGVHNINFVTPDHFWPHIAFAARTLRSEGFSLPFLFNSSGYQRQEMVPRYAEWMDIFMPDFKFADGELAKTCMGDKRYPDIARAALLRMVELKGFLHPWDPSGHETAKTGVLVRHLILPGHVENTLEALRWLRHEFGPRIPLSVMSQFHPVPACRARKQLTRRISREEHQRVLDEIARLGFQHVFIQPYLPTTDFLPDFERNAPFEGNRQKRLSD